MTDKPMPKYRQLKREILGWLESGRLRPDDQMPSENEIAEQFGMSRQTVRQTFGELEREGRLYRIQGKGTFVQDPNAARADDPQTIGIITTYISDYIFPHIVRGAESALRSRGYRLTLSSTDNDKRKERECLRMMTGQPLSGLIIEPTKSAEGNPNLSYYLELEYRKVPYLMINERYPEMTCPYLKLDDETGGFRAADHLIRLGHRRIAGFFKTDDLQGVNRMKGFLRAHKQHGLPLPPELVIHYKTEEKTSKPYERLSALLALSPEQGRPTAMVCYNDELAVQLLDAVRRHGLAVPHDLSVVGFDDASLATATEVKLTTLTHPKTAMGEAAAERLIALIEGRATDSEPAAVIYTPELIVRGSTRQV